MSRCPWCEYSGKMIRYHDEEWGVPVHDDRKQFEFLMMEAMQCGLSWNLMIEKREIFRACFADFDYDVIARFDENDVERILATPGMIRSASKIHAVIANARSFQQIRQDHRSFSEWLWSFSDGKTICYEGHEAGRMPAANALSEIIAKALKKYGFKYLGPVTVYAHLQACGIVNDHLADCFRYRDIIEHAPTVWLPCDGER